MNAKKNNNKKHYIEEYLEVGDNMRQFGNLRFAQMTLFFALMAGFIAALFQFPNTNNTISYVIKIVSFVTTILFWVMDQRAMAYWNHYRKRGIKLEKKLNYKQYTNAPATQFLSATNAIRVFYLLALIFWIIYIFV